MALGKVFFRDDGLFCGGGFTYLEKVVFGGRCYSMQFSDERFSSLLACIRLSGPCLTTSKLSYAISTQIGIWIMTVGVGVVEWMTAP